MFKIPDAVLDDIKEGCQVILSKMPKMLKLHLSITDKIGNEIYTGNVLGRSLLACLIYFLN